MATPPEPGEPGFSLRSFLGFGLRVAIRLARLVGLGVPLRNALIERFPEIETELASGMAGIVGQGSRAAFGLNQPPHDRPFDPRALPTTGHALFESQPGERYFIQTVGSGGILDTGRPAERTITIYSTDPMSYATITEEIERMWRQFQESSPKFRGLDPTPANVQVMFLAKRF